VISGALLFCFDGKVAWKPRVWWLCRLDHGADAMLQDSDGETPLHKARKQVRLPVVPPSCNLMDECSPVIYTLELETLLLDAPGPGSTLQKFVMRRSSFGATSTSMTHCQARRHSCLTG
jgi:hypothetical protein